MAKDTKIEWAHHTFNPWIGCSKVSPACDNCYAERFGTRFGIEWGAGKHRKRTAASTWQHPLRWNRKAEIQFNAWERFKSDAGLSDEQLIAKGFTKPDRPRVFCASLADVFDNEVPSEWRADLIEIIAETPNLDWLLLTKRIGNAHQMLINASNHAAGWTAFPNVWLGITVCNQEEANRDIPKLLAVPAAKRFLSIEPLLGPVDLQLHFFTEPTGNFRTFNGKRQMQLRKPDDGGVHWVIAGGESGPNARPMHPNWVRDLRDQCDVAEVPFFFKQWGEWAPFVREEHYTHGGEEKHPHAWVCGKSAESGLCWVVDDDGLWSNWTGNPPASDDGEQESETVHVMGRYGRKSAGRTLDGRPWEEVPI